MTNIILATSNLGKHKRRLLHLLAVRRPAALCKKSILLTGTVDLEHPILEHLLEIGDV